MKWRSVAATAAWVAVCTAAGGLGAWQLAGADATAGAGTGPRGRTLDDAAVRRALASATSSAGPSSGASPGSSTSADRRRTLRFVGGSATVECGADGTVYLVSWSPAGGYEIDGDDVVRGPGRVARLKVEPSDDDADDLEYRVRCGAGSSARAERVAESDD
ncbi:hypothetical protein GTY65_32175 [Streptomyces sp. SID8379]|uniref:hypothetical protein n=1 Tax=unclassified Streptomyces TaxID=2593676 RepID=UPI000379249D|nr:MULTISPECIES: hypothetical protein [unclassified Streptomyces]MYW68702.1 hypothetical protein [Streptomyces sp. SID8379]